MPLQKARLKISDYNEQRKASLRKKERRLQMISLSLTSMVDMFAILVIFLLTNTSTVSQWFEVGKGIDLPKAKYSEAPSKGATLQVSSEGIFADNKLLLALDELNDQPTSLAKIKEWLSANHSEKLVNIVGHERLPFGAIKKLVVACQESGYQNVNLAVQPLSN